MPHGNPEIVGAAMQAVATTASGTFALVPFRKARLRRFIISQSSAAGVATIQGCTVTSIVVDGTAYVGGTSGEVPAELFEHNSITNPLFDIMISRDSTISVIVKNGTSATVDLVVSAIAIEE